MKNGGHVQLQGLWVDLEEFRLREIDLEVQAGQYSVILGPTGAGKTVLLETIAGLWPQSRGRILLDGEDITGAPPERRGVGFVYQDYALFPHLSVGENIAFGLTLKGMHHTAVRDRVDKISAMLDIRRLLGRRTGTLSGGEQQRTALARALIVEPRLLLLDEPLSALDPETRETLRHDVGRLQRRLGVTTIHVTHDFEEAVALADRVAVMNDGRIVQVGTPEDIFRRPASEFVARFVGVRNVFKGVAHQGDDGHSALSAEGLDIAVVTALTGHVHGSVRPEDILISKEPLRSSARNCFVGRVVSIVERGAIVWVTVRVPPDFTCMITRTSLEEMGLREGMEVHIAFKSSAVHVF